MILNQYNTHNRRYKFVVKDAILEGENIFTVLVGKNGTGKSSLLSAVIRELLGTIEEKLVGDSELGFHKRILRGEVDTTSNPEVIVAISTSPFDKFPLVRRHDDTSTYSYLGLRDLMSANFGLAYMSKIIVSLIESVIMQPYQISHIQSVLGYLGYKGKIHASFSLISSKTALTEIVESDDPYALIINRRIFPLRNLNRKLFMLENGDVDHDKIKELVYVSKRILQYGVAQRCNFIIDENGVNIDGGYDFVRDEIIFLMRSGLLKLRNLGLESLKSGKTYSIKDASSGEQSVILSILGIASKIQNNSLICIDEPEVCLHPEWQEKYIQILVATFSKYKNCHFILATHSPQIISRLRFTNSFILQMETGEVISAEQFVNNSVDFQLANIFDSPGYKNEYLSRIALNIFTKVSRKKVFDSDDNEKFKLLVYQSQFMDNDDPVKNIIEAINEMRKIYGGH